MSAVSLSAHSASVGPCMTWITCQPNSVLTGSRSWPGWRPGLKIASAKPWASWSSVEKYGSLPPVVTAESSSLSARAIESNCDGSVLSFSHVALASTSAFAQAGSPSGTGAVRPRRVVGRVEDVADPDRGRARLAGTGLHEDLRHLALRARDQAPGEDRVAELGPGDVSAERGAEVVEADARVGDLAGQGRVHDRGDDLRHAADAEAAVGALDHLGGGVLGGRQQSREERRVERRVLVDEAEVAGLLLARVGGHGLGDGLPVLAGLQVGERLVGLGPGGGDGLVGGLRRAVGELGRHLDHPRVAELGSRGLLGKRGVDVRGGDGHALARPRARPGWCRRPAARARAGRSAAGAGRGRRSGSRRPRR